MTLTLTLYCRRCCILQHISLRWRHQMQWITFSVENRKFLLWHVRAAAATDTAGSPLLWNRSIIYRRGTETKVSSQYQYKHWYQHCRYLDLYTFHATVVRFPLTYWCPLHCKLCLSEMCFISESFLFVVMTPSTVKPWSKSNILFHLWHQINYSYTSS